MVSMLDSGSSILGLSPCQGHSVVYLGKTLYFHNVSLHLSNEFSRQCDRNARRREKGMLPTID